MKIFRNFLASGIGLLLLLLSALCARAVADADEGANREFRHSLLRPVKLVSVGGNVQNAQAMVEDHEGYATLTMTAGGAAPMVILDYGRDVGGIPVFEIAAVSGTPKLQAFYSESQQYLLPAGDGNSPAGVSFVGDCGAGDLARAD